jgi:hypothetical protein
MEEFDDLVRSPDDSGALDLSHQAWTALDDVIWSWCVCPSLPSRSSVPWCLPDANGSACCFNKYGHKVDLAPASGSWFA